MAVISRLPNRAYSTNLSDKEDATNVDGTLSRLLVYALLELASLFLLDWMLRRRMRFSPLA